MARTRVRSRSISNAAKDVRKYVAVASAMLAAGDQSRAYAAAEAAQFAAFDMKLLIEGSAVEYVPGQNAPEWMREGQGDA